MRGGTREQGLVFGEVASFYDDVRAPYPDGLVDAALAYAGSPLMAIEIGTGTGKGTESVARGLTVTCVEPDPAMAAVLRERFGERVRVV